jgi:ubiquinone/menaquinone biosynthesis C-methylase UbiE
MKCTLTSIALGTKHWLRNAKYLPAYIRGPNRDRNQSWIFENYNDRWVEIETDIPKAKRNYHTPRLMVLDSRFVHATTAELNQRHVRTHFEGITRYYPSGQTPEKILEVGGGHGRTLFPVSLLFPRSNFYALEYAQAGPAAAAKYRQEFAEEIRQEALSVSNNLAVEPPVREFINGDGKNLPYDDKSFDVSYTNLVLEQIPNPNDHDRVLNEMRRVTRKLCCFLEPWADAQTLLTFAFLRNNDYFRERSSKLLKLGFKKVHYQSLNFHANLRFRYGYAVAEVD